MLVLSVFPIRHFYQRWAPPSPSSGGPRSPPGSTPPNEPSPTLTPLCGTRQFGKPPRSSRRPTAKSRVADWHWDSSPMTCSTAWHLPPWVLTTVVSGARSVSPSGRRMGPVQRRGGRQPGRRPRDIDLPPVGNPGKARDRCAARSRRAGPAGPRHRLAARRPGRLRRRDLPLPFNATRTGPGPRPGHPDRRPGNHRGQRPVLPDQVRDSQRDRRPRHRPRRNPRRRRRRPGTRNAGRAAALPHFGEPSAARRRASGPACRPGDHRPPRPR